MDDDISLSDREMEAVLSQTYMKTPRKTGIFRGARFSLSTKIGGRMQMVQVICKGDPYEHRMSNGKTALCVDVYGYGVDKRVNVSKLREVRRG